MAETKHARAPIRILLGGGIGSGKGVAGRRFERFGAVVVEADRLGHAVLESDGEAFGAVTERWPSVIIDHRIDRSALAEIVFDDTAQLAELEAMTHLPIIERITEIASSAADLVIEIPLILDVPGEWTKVYIAASEGIRLRRAVERGSSETDVAKRMASQPTRDEWMTWSDTTLDNNSSVGNLEGQIDALWYGLRTTDYGLRARS